MLYGGYCVVGCCTLPRCKMAMLDRLSEADITCVMRRMARWAIWQFSAASSPNTKSSAPSVRTLMWVGLSCVSTCGCGRRASNRLLLAIVQIGRSASVVLQRGTVHAAGVHLDPAAPRAKCRVEVWALCRHIGWGDLDAVAAIRDFNIRSAAAPAMLCSSSQKSVADSN